MYKHYVHSIGTGGILNYLYVRGPYASPSRPKRIYMRSSSVYTFFEGSNQLHIADISANTIIYVNLPTSKPDCRVTPDRQKAVVWDTGNGEVFIHSMNSSFNLLYTYWDNITGGGSAPQYVTLNSDGKYLILETDNQFPVRIISTESGAIFMNLTFSYQIYCANFIDTYNRFIFMQTAIGDVFFDTINSTSNYYVMNGIMANWDTRVDFLNRILYNVGENNVGGYGVNASFN